MWMRLDGSYGGQYIWKKKISHKCCLSTAPGKLGDVNQIQIFFHLSSTGTHSIDWSIDWSPLPPFPNQPTPRHPPPPLAFPSTQVSVPNYVSRGIIAASIGLNGWFCVYEYLWICACVFVSLCACMWGWEALVFSLLSPREALCATQSE